MKPFVPGLGILPADRQNDPSYWKNRAAMRFRILPLLCLCLVSIVNAAEAPLDTTRQFESPYDIEVVIFERFGTGNTEQWPEDPGRPNIAQAVGNLSIPGKQGSNAIILPKDARELGPAVYTLSRKGARVHAHQAWRQDIRDRNSSTWYWIGNRQLNGLIRVSKGRYLHLDTDLLLKSSEGDNDYRVKLHRRMRGGELHYVDHPKVGILIRTSRLELEPALRPEPELETPAPVSPVDEPGEQRSPMPGSLPRAMPDPT